MMKTNQVTADVRAAAVVGPCEKADALLTTDLRLGPLRKVKKSRSMVGGAIREVTLECGHRQTRRAWRASGKTRMRCHECARELRVQQAYHGDPDGDIEGYDGA